MSEAARGNEFQVEMKDGSSAADLFTAVADRFGDGVKRYLYDDRGVVIPAWRIVLNGRPLNEKGNALSVHALRDGDTIEFLLSLAGG